MGVSTTHYIVMGIAITDKVKVKEFFKEFNDFDDFDDNSYAEKISPTVSGIHIISDGMCGEYVVIGKILYKSQQGFPISKTIAPAQDNDERESIFMKISELESVFDTKFKPDDMKYLIFTHWH